MTEFKEGICATVAFIIFFVLLPSVAGSVELGASMWNFLWVIPLFLIGAAAQMVLMSEPKRKRRKRRCKRS